MALVVSDEVQEAELVTSWVLLSLRVAVAVSWIFDPAATVGEAGVIAIEVIAGALFVTVSIVLPEIVPTVAVIIAVPTVTAVAKPGLVPPVCTVATAVVEEAHVAELVKF